MTTPRDPTKIPPPARARHRAALEALIRSKGLGRFALFDTTGEGRFYPNGMEETSGSVLDDRGRVFDFWTAWDAERGEATFRIWREVRPDPRLPGSTSYRRARAAVGLSGPAV